MSRTGNGDPGTADFSPSQVPDAFVWDDTFITGLDQVDTQHHELVDAFNELNRSLLSPGENPEASLQRIYDRMIGYAHYHFRDEEALMVREGIDPRHVEAHRLLHEQFIEQVHALWAQRDLLRGHPETIVGFLTAWLGLHILGIDRSMARQIELIRNGTSADKAFEQEARAHDNSTTALLRMISKLYRVLTAQNTALSRAKDRLEERVEQRTAELARANESLQEANVRLEAFSRTDGLLQIANRGYFDERLQSQCLDGMRNGRNVGLLMIDVDYFKRYNDRHGHQAGDDCLRAVAQAVKRAAPRATDLVARYGGEELAVILPDTGPEGALLVAQRVVREVAALKLPHGASDASPQVTVSVGAVSRIPGTRDAPKSLIADADAALYEAKSSGRNRALLFEAERAT